MQVTLLSAVLESTEIPQQLYRMERISSFLGNMCVSIPKWCHVSNLAVTLRLFKLTKKTVTSLLHPRATAVLWRAIEKGRERGFGSQLFCHRPRVKRSEKGAVQMLQNLQDRLRLTWGIKKIFYKTRVNLSLKKKEKRKKLKSRYLLHYSML